MSYYLCRVSIEGQVNASSAESSVVPDQAKRLADDDTSEVETDNLLVQEVEEFVEKLMDWYVNTWVMHVFTSYSQCIYLS